MIIFKVWAFFFLRSKFIAATLCLREKGRHAKDNGTPNVKIHKAKLSAIKVRAQTQGKWKVVMTGVLLKIYL